ncbi:MAG: hypothetical protein KFF68_04320 [Desulfosarcina sp.]|nr:hypothetical protein [Desulfosarcina sp.]
MVRPAEAQPALGSGLICCVATGPEARPTAILGGVSVDPAGKKAGVWYLLYRRTTIRFEPGNVMVVSLPSADNDPYFMDGRRRPGMRH